MFPGGVGATQTGIQLNTNQSSLYPNLPPWLAFNQGNVWHVKPFSGSDITNSGRLPDSSFKTLGRALSVASPNQNDIILFYSEGNSSDRSSCRVSATLDWNKDNVHLIGVNSGSGVSNRSRLAFVSGYATASNLFTLSANGCYIANVQFFEGVASALPTGCVKVTGTRNVFENCHLAGIGNDANDIADAYSLWLATGSSENTFRNCAIGLDTIGAGTNANQEILLTSGTSRNLFDSCLIYRMLESATNHPLVGLTGATAIDRFLWFRNCMFLNESVNYAIAQAGNFKLSAPLTQGFIILENPMTNPSDNSTAVKWDVGDGNQIALFNAPTPAADTAGVARMV